MIDRIIKATENYLENAKVNDLTEFKMIRNINNILKEQKIPNYNLKYIKRIPIEKSIMYVQDFLYNLDLYYYEYFNQMLDNNTFDFEDNDEELAFCDLVDNKPYIYVPYQKNIEDAHKIVHEFMHILNLPKDDKFNITRYMYTESLSYLVEFLFHDYTKKRKIKDNLIPIKSLLLDVKNIALEIDFNLSIIEESLQKGYVAKDIIYDTFDKFEINDVGEINRIISDIDKSELLTLDTVQQYGIGILIATYMYDRIQTNSKNIIELFELNKLIQKVQFEEILDYLDLSYTSYDLTDESYIKLKKCYKKYIKRI